MFDAELTFVNGGGMVVTGFRLDLPSADVGDEELGELLVRHLGLLMVGEVRFSRKEIIVERHKGSRGVLPRRIVDLSHVIRDGMVTVTGLPAPRISDFRSHAESAPNYAPGTSFQFGHFDMVSQTGTYLDSPYHRYPDGVDLSGVPLASTVDLPGVLIRTAAPVIDVAALEPLNVKGKALLINTGWDRHWGTPEYDVKQPYLTRAAAEWLVRGGVALVGVDTCNVDTTADPERPVHSTLLAAGIPIVEHLRGLDALPDGDGWMFHAAPLAVEGMGTSPVRAYAVVGG